MGHEKQEKLFGNYYKFIVCVALFFCNGNQAHKPSLSLKWKQNFFVFFGFFCN